MNLLRRGLVLVLIGALSGCAGGGGNASPAPQPVTPPPSTTPVAPSASDTPTGLLGAVGDLSSPSELETADQYIGGMGSSSSGTSTAPYCGGEHSPANPYRCCKSDGSGLTTSNGQGNCVWLAWHLANTKMGVSLPKWGDAKSWLSGALNGIRANPNAPFAVSYSPVANSIGVMINDNYGHVAYIESVNPDGSIVALEQNCAFFDKQGKFFVGSGTQRKTYSKGRFTGFIVSKAAPAKQPAISNIQISNAVANSQVTFDVAGTNLDVGLKFTLANPMTCSAASRIVDTPSNIRWTCQLPNTYGPTAISILHNGSTIFTKDFSIAPAVANQPPVVTSFTIAGQPGRVYGSVAVSDSDLINRLRIHLGRSYDSSECQINVLNSYESAGAPGLYAFDTTSNSNNCSSLISSPGIFYAKVEVWDAVAQASVVRNSFSIASQQVAIPTISSIDVYNFNYSQNKMYSGVHSYNNVVVAVKGSNLPSTAVVDVHGLTCNISAPATIAAVPQVGLSVLTSPNNASGLSTYSLTTGADKGFVSVCQGAYMAPGSSYLVTVKSAPGGMGGTPIGSSISVIAP